LPIDIELLGTLSPNGVISIWAWLYDVSMSGIFRDWPDSDSTDRLVSAVVLLRHEPDEENDEEEDDRKEEDDDDDESGGDGYSE